MCVRGELYKEINKIPIVDIHTHVDFQNPFAKNAWEILSYHYFTEMAHSQGMASEIVTSPKYSFEKKIEKLSKYLPGMQTTEPYRWLMHLLKRLFNFPYSHLGADNWKSFVKCVENKAKSPNRLEEICKLSNIEIISTTNLPWENLDGIENHKNRKGKQLFIPTFRVDLLLTADKTTIKKLGESTGKEISNLKDYENAIVNRLSYFKGKGAKSLAISLSPNPMTMHIDKKESEEIFDKILKDKPTDSSKLSAYMLDFLSSLCEEYNLAFQLMIGVERGVYTKGIPGGEDVFQTNGSLLGLKYLLNKYSDVKFPISVLSSNQDKELAVYARIFPNVYASSHWWFENTYESIKSNLKNRLKLTPHTKLIGQYSDAYTTELIEAKLDMYRHVLSEVLAEYIKEKRVDEKQALNIAKDLLYNSRKKFLVYKQSNSAKY
jgi:glucuronate isomerase